MVARVKRITNKLIAKTPAIRPDAAKWPWEVHVITVDEQNAWCMPHSKMVIYSGLITKVKANRCRNCTGYGTRNFSCLREHSREQVSRQQTTGLFAGILGAVGQAYIISGANDIASIGAEMWALIYRFHVPMRPKRIYWGWNWQHVRVIAQMRPSHCGIKCWLQMAQERLNS